MKCYARDCRNMWCSNPGICSVFGRQATSNIELDENGRCKYYTATGKTHLGDRIVYEHTKCSADCINRSSEIACAAFGWFETAEIVIAPGGICMRYSTIEEEETSRALCAN